MIGERGEARGAFAPICINLSSSAVDPSSLCAFAVLSPKIVHFLENSPIPSSLCDFAPLREIFLWLRLCRAKSLREFFLRLPCAFLRLFRLGYRLSAIGYRLLASRFAPSLAPRAPRLALDRSVRPSSGWKHR